MIKLQETIKRLLDDKDYKGIESLLYRAKVIGESDFFIEEISNYSAKKLIRYVSDSMIGVEIAVMGMVEECEDEKASLIQGGHFKIDNLSLLIDSNRFEINRAIQDVRSVIVKILEGIVNGTSNIDLSHWNRIEYDVLNRYMHRTIKFEIGLSYNDNGEKNVSIMKHKVKFNLRDVLDRRADIERIVTKCTNEAWKCIDLSDEYSGVVIINDENNVTDCVESRIKEALSEEDNKLIEQIEVIEINMKEQCWELQEQKKRFAEAMRRFGEKGVA